VTSARTLFGDDLSWFAEGRRRERWEYASLLRRSWF
jgi:hypothetical protein